MIDNDARMYRRLPYPPLKILPGLISLFTRTVLQTINLFINSDAILNRDALWSIQGKNTI